MKSEKIPVKFFWHKFVNEFFFIFDAFKFIIEIIILNIVKQIDVKMKNIIFEILNKKNDKNKVIIFINVNIIEVKFNFDKFR